MLSSAVRKAIGSSAGHGSNSSAGSMLGSAVRRVSLGITGADNERASVADTLRRTGSAWMTKLIAPSSYPVGRWLWKRPSVNAQEEEGVKRAGRRQEFEDKAREWQDEVSLREEGKKRGPMSDLSGALVVTSVGVRTVKFLF